MALPAINQEIKKWCFRKFLRFGMLCNVAASHATFVSALEAGKDQITAHSEAFQSNDDPDTQLISISAARAMGVMPLGADADKSNR